MTLATLGLAMLAGLLSTLSPCILPILPVVLGAALAQHRLGPVALAAGVSLSFVSFGLLIATVGVSIGLDGETFRKVAAAVIVALGLALIMPQLNVRLASATAPISAWGHNRLAQVSAGGLGGQFLIGILLGAAWSPCVGPTLGAASMLAAQGQDLGQAGLTMLTFGIGAALPLVLLGFMSRQALLRWRGRLANNSRSLITAFGILLVITGLMVMTNLDREIETVLVRWYPEWLIGLTTRF